MQQPPMSPLKRKSRIGISIVLAVIFAVALVGCSESGTGDSTVTPTPTHVVNLAATTAPTVAPTKKPTPTPTLKPTPVPTHAVVPTQPPVHPTPTQPACQAVNNNPWCYNFSSGKLIYVPPGGFCSYFNCISTFYGSDDPGDGYIVECDDGAYSQSGGESGACSYHGGVMRPLYSH
jgi:hypothetical protein